VSGRRLWWVACCLLVTGGYLEIAGANEFVPSPEALHALPLQLGDWHSRGEQHFDRDTERVLQADSYILRTYTRGAVPLSLFVAYYASQRTGHTIHSPLNCLPGSGWTWVDREQRNVTVGSGRTITISHNIASLAGQSVAIDYWYQSRDRAVVSEYSNKLLLIADSLQLHRSDGAIVRVTAPLAGDSALVQREVLAFVADMFDPLTAHLPQ